MLLQKLTALDLVYPVGVPIFTPLTAAHFGNVLTPADGFDMMLMSVLRELPTDEAGLSDLDRHLAGAQFQTNRVATDELGPLVVEYAANVKNMEASVKGIHDAFVMSMAPVAPPAPTPTPTPPGGGGGGGRGPNKL